MKKQILNEAYALIYQLLCVPIFAYISYIVFKLNIIDTNLIITNRFLSFLFIALVMGFNVCAVMMVTYLMRKSIELDMKHYMITGFAGLLVITWIKTYYGVMTNYACSEFLNSKMTCSEAISANRIVLYLLVIDLAYYLLFIITQSLLDATHKRNTMKIPSHPKLSKKTPDLRKIKVAR